MLGRDLSQQRHIGSSRTGLATATQNCSAKRCPLLAEGIGNTDPVGLSIVDDIDALIMLRLVEVVGTSRALMAVCCSNAEVGYLASRTQCRHQVIGARATDSCTFLSQAGVRIGRANLG